MSLTETPRVVRAPRRGRLLTARTPLVDVLTDLLDGLPPERRERARRAVHARMLSVRRGKWDGAGDAEDYDCHGFVVIEGTLLRGVTAGHREGAELLGPGDLLQPADENGPATWRAVTEATLAILDTRTLADAGAVPELAGAMLSAVSGRTNAIARQLVIAQWASVDERIVATMELLAERWGIVSADGLVLPAFLTHSVLAPLVGARRPSVTTSLKRLDASGAVRRAGDGRWIVARHTG